MSRKRVRVRESRDWTLTDVELREAGDGRIEFRGLAAVFNMPSEDLGGYREVIAPGAFSKTLREQPDVTLLYNHQPDSVMARTTNGTLRIAETQVGLEVEARLDPNDVDVARVAPKMRSGLVDRMSFAFWPIRDDMVPGDDGQMVRVQREVALDGGDVSIVTNPAYRQTAAQVRQLLASLDEFDPADLFPQLRAGRVLSGTNLDLLDQAIAALTQIRATAAEELAEPADVEAAEGECEMPTDGPIMASGPSGIDVYRARLILAGHKF